MNAWGGWCAWLTGLGKKQHHRTAEWNQNEHHARIKRRAQRKRKYCTNTIFLIGIALGAAIGAAIDKQMKKENE